MTTALQQMDWSSFEIDYDSFSCNNDHDNATVYLHALPSNQTALFAWARLVETTLAAAGIPTIILGPGDIAQAHTKDEFITLTDLEAGTIAYIDLARALLPM